MDNIKVYARIRPMNEKQKYNDSYAYSNVTNNKITMKQNVNILYNNTNEFNFDNVFGPSISQKQVFETVGKNIIQSIFKGINGTIFTYGQTSSGKTFTCMGPDIYNQELKGLFPRIAENIFEKINQIGNSVQFSIKFSVIEIYLEKIKDLLDNKKFDLKIRQSKKGVFIQNITQVYISNPSQIIKYIKVANKNRTTARTNMNQQSSRSHMILILQLYQNNKIQLQAKIAKLFIVDLAGSESISKTGAQGKILDQAKQINKSLVTLGMVINSLTQKLKSHIPYRDSKLTRILQESLGGNAKSNLIINLAPTMSNYSEIVNTLRFGQRAKNVKNVPKVNKQYTVAQLLLLLNKSQYIIKQKQQIIEKLMNEIKKLENKNSSQIIQKISKQIKDYDEIRLNEKIQIDNNESQDQNQEKLNQTLLKQNQQNKIKENMHMKQINKILQQKSYEIKKILNQKLEISRQLQILTQRNEEYKSKTEILQNKITQINQKSYELTNQNNKLTQKCNQLSDNITIYEKQIQKIKNQIIRLKDFNKIIVKNEGQQKNNLLQSCYTGVLNKVNSKLSHSNSIMMIRHESAIKPIKIEKKTEQTSNLNFKQKIKQLEDQLNESKEQNKLLSKQNEQLNIQVNYLFSQIQQKIQRIQELQEQVNQQTQRKQTLLTVISGLDQNSKIRKIVQLENKLNTFIGEYMILKNQESKWNTYNEKKQKQIQRKNQRIQILQRELKSLQVDYNSIQNKYDQLALYTSTISLIGDTQIKREISSHTNNIIKFANSIHLNVVDEDQEESIISN